MNEGANDVQATNDRTDADRHGSAPPDEPHHELWASPEDLSAGARVWVEKTLRLWAAEHHPLIKKFGTETVSEPASAEDMADIEPDLASPYYRSIPVQVGATLSLDEILDFDVPAYLGQLSQMADDWGGQLVKGAFTHISEVSDATGNTIDATGRDFGDVMLDALEGLELSFDESGDPVLPTIAMHPNTAAKLTGKDLTPQQKQRMAEILERKKEEHRASQRRPELR